MLPDTQSLVLFIMASLILLVVPGPAVFFIVARSIGQGCKAGLISTLGVHAGTGLHIAAAALGLSALLTSSVIAFNLLRIIGAAYLIYLGVRMLRQSDERTTLIPVSKNAMGRIFLDGFLVNVLNPKTALFFLAFLPQFADPSRGTVAAQIALLGGLFAVLGVITDSAYALLANTLSNWFRRNTRISIIQRYFTGSVFVSLGLLTAFSGTSRK